MKTLALAFAILCGAQEPPKAPAVLALASDEPDVSDAKADGGLLIRELVRQAVLIAGRDGLGLQTRDQVLGEPFPETAVVLKIHTKAIAGKSVSVKLDRKSTRLNSSHLKLSRMPSSA